MKLAMPVLLPPTLSRWEREQTNRYMSFSLMQRVLLLLALCVAAPAQAGLFSDDEARKQIQQLETRAPQFETRAQQLGGFVQHRRMPAGIKTERCRAKNTQATCRQISWQRSRRQGQRNHRRS